MKIFAIVVDNKVISFVTEQEQVDELTVLEPTYSFIEFECPDDVHPLPMQCEIVDGKIVLNLE
jgi:hypothetical protein